MSAVMIQETVDIEAPVEQVWGYLVDWPRQSDWIPATHVWGVDEGAGIGTQIEAWSGLGRVGFLDTMTITAWDPPHRCEVLHTGRVMRGEGGFVLAPRGADGSRLDWWERLRVPGGAAGPLVAPLVGPLSRQMIRRALGNLKRGVETGPRRP